MTITLDRRHVLMAGAGALAASFARPARAAGEFPDKPIQVLIPTGEGGGVDQAARAFNRIWSKYLGANFEYSYSRRLRPGRLRSLRLEAPSGRLQHPLRQYRAGDDHVRHPEGEV